jgi:hypothetical protein
LILEGRGHIAQTQVFLQFGTDKRDTHKTPFIKAAANHARCKLGLDSGSPNLGR